MALYLSDKTLIGEQIEMGNHGGHGDKWEMVKGVLISVLPREGTDPGY